jgi:hypothetical protein
MDPDQQTLHLDHVDGTDEYAGLSHSQCNLSAGGRLGQSRRWGTPQQSPVSARREIRRPAPPGIQEYVVPPGVHARGWCYVCRGPDCSQAGPDSPLGRQPW